MTQEEKAKAYDEALERARAIINDYEERGLEEILFYAKEDLGCIFPELAESEDERIRKRLIFDFQVLGKTEWGDLKVKDILAWLEKQGETYTKKDVDDAYLRGVCDAKNELEKQVKPKEYTFKSIPRLLDMIEPSDRATAYCQKLIGSLVREGYNTDAKIVGECLKKMNGEDVPMAVMDEKQGNKETLCDKCRKEQPSHSCQDITANGRCYIEGMNTSNNVKPKFKVGDILKHNKANIVCKVLSANVGFYSLISILGGDEMELSNVEKNFHLWTIKDANNGDVLQLGTVTAIFKKYIGQEKCICYCSIDENGVFEIPIEDGEDNIYGCTNTTPATKEQRALLFQKMNEEGYEWNAELKKVSKITTPADVGFEELGKAWAEEANKQNLANSAKTCKKSQRMISAAAKEALYDKPATIDIDKMVDDYANNEEFGKPLNCMVRAYRQGLKDAIGKVVSESAWSEEDETGWTNTMIMIKECASHHYTKDSIKLVIDWLKSLKKRIGE